jgi:hypothetical protein
MISDLAKSSSHENSPAYEPLREFGPDGENPNAHDTDVRTTPAMLPQQLLGTWYLSSCYSSDLSHLRQVSWFAVTGFLIILGG